MTCARFCIAGTMWAVVFPERCYMSTLFSSSKHSHAGSILVARHHPSYWSKQKQKGCSLLAVTDPPSIWQTLSPAAVPQPLPNAQLLIQTMAVSDSTCKVSLECIYILDNNILILLSVVHSNIMFVCLCVLKKWSVKAWAWLVLQLQVSCCAILPRNKHLEQAAVQLCITPVVYFIQIPGLGI